MARVPPAAAAADAVVVEEEAVDVEAKGVLARQTLAVVLRLSSCV
jgi:hypothetical protein